MRYIALVGAFILGSVCAGSTLEVGDRAPALGDVEWLRGGASLEPGRVHVVELWATWCAPCVAAFPHLSRLAAEHAADVTVIGVAAMERGDPSDVRTRLRQFVDEHATVMKYHVGFDAGGRMAETWMAAFGQAGIPAAFVIDRDGRVVFVGHPLELDEPLAQILAGTWDLERHRSEVRTRRRATEELMQTRERVTAAREEGRWADLLALIDEAITRYPAQAATWGAARPAALARLGRRAEAYAETERLRAAGWDNFGRLLALAIDGFAGGDEFIIGSSETLGAILDRIDQILPSNLPPPARLVLFGALAKANRNAGRMDRADALVEQLMADAKADASPPECPDGVCTVPPCEDKLL